MNFIKKRKYGKKNIDSMRYVFVIAFVYCFPFEHSIIFEDLKKHYCNLTQLFECIKRF